MQLPSWSVPDTQLKSVPSSFCPLHLECTSVLAQQLKASEATNHLTKASVLTITVKGTAHGGSVTLTRFGGVDPDKIESLCKPQEGTYLLR